MGVLEILALICFGIALLGCLINLILIIINKDDIIAYDIIMWSYGILLILGWVFRIIALFI